MRPWTLPLLLVTASLARAGDGLTSPEKADDERRQLRAALTRHFEDERARAAKALLRLARLEEEAGRAAEAARLYGKVAAAFPERVGDLAEAARRSRALEERGGEALEAVLAKAAKARGRAALEKLSGLTMRGAIKLGDRSYPYTCELALGATIKAREDVPELKIAKGWNGQVGWRLEQGRVEVLRGPELDRTVAWAREARREALGRRLGRPFFLGPSLVQGRAAYQVRFGAKDEAWTVDFDAASGLPARGRGRRISALGKPTDLTLYFSDWRRIKGAAFPFLIEAYEGDKLQYSFVYEVIALDPKRPTGRFDPPAAGSAPEGEKEEKR